MVVKKKRWGAVRYSKLFWTFGVNVGSRPEGGYVASVYFWRRGWLIYLGGPQP